MARLFDKINDANTATLQSRAKASTILYPIAAAILGIIALIILVTGFYEKNYLSGIFGFTILALLAAAFCFAAWWNRGFLKKTGAEGKTQKELLEKSFKSQINIFKK